MKEKTRKLVAYTWKRFGKKKLGRWLIWCVRAWCRGALAGNNKPKNSERCDVLVMHTSAMAYGLKRFDNMVERLKKSGLIVEEIIAFSEKEIVKEKACCGPFEFGFLFRCYEGYSNWIRARYNPKVIITFRNGSFFSPFFKSKYPGDAVVFHMAHSVLTAQSSRFHMLDYDYYCIYGKSSLEHLKKLPETYGSCQIVLGGSYLFDESYVAEKPNKDLPLLFLGMGPELEETREGIKIYDTICEWQKSSGKTLYIRLHQRSKGKYWQRIVREGIKIVSRGETFKESAGRASIILAPYTNAVLDAALLGRPIQLVAFPDELDYLQVERFFGPRANDFGGIETGIDKLYSNYEDSLNACKKFCDYHLERGCYSVSYINDVLVDICAGKEIAGTEFIGDACL